MNGQVKCAIIAVCLAALVTIRPGQQVPMVYIQWKPVKNTAKYVISCKSVILATILLEAASSWSGPKKTCSLENIHIESLSYNGTVQNVNILHRKVYSVTPFDLNISVD